MKEKAQKIELHKKGRNNVASTDRSDALKEKRLNKNLRSLVDSTIFFFCCGNKFLKACHKKRQESHLICVFHFESFQ